MRSAREADCATHGKGLRAVLCEKFRHIGPPAWDEKCEEIKRKCTQSVAERSTRSVFPDVAKKCVAEAFEECYNDRRVPEMN